MGNGRFTWLIGTGFAARTVRAVLGCEVPKSLILLFS
ncbi:hypothetical protein LINPERHAP1_LOCUS11322 [Linum perenne]